MSKSEYIDCEYYVKSLDQASLRIAGQQVDSPIALGVELNKLGQIANTTPEESPETLLERGIDRLNRLNNSEGTGSKLFGLLIPSGSNIETLYLAYQNQRLRFMLHIAPEVSGLHRIFWETLTDPGFSVSRPSNQRNFARGERALFLRYIDQQCRLKTLKDQTLRVLVAIASPEDLEESDATAHIQDRRNKASVLHVDKLRADLDQTLGRHPQTYDVDYLQLPVTAVELRTRLTEGKYHILHLIAHGTKGSKGTGILLQGETNSFIPLSSEVFSSSIPATSFLRLVVLMVCNSAASSSVDRPESLASTLVKKGFPAIIATNQRISTDEATIFAKGFYDTLHLTGEVDRAANSGRQALYLSHSRSDRFGAVARIPRNWSKPVLFTQKGSERIWQTLRDSARRRRLLARARTSLVAVLLLCFIITIWMYPKPPVAAIIEIEKAGLSKGSNNDQLKASGLLHVIDAALERVVNVDTEMPLVEGQPHIKLSATISRNKEPQPTASALLTQKLDTTIILRCTANDFPTRPPWWPWTAASEHCGQLNLLEIKLDSTDSISEVENAMRRSLDLPLTGPLQLESTVAQTLRSAST